MNHFRDKTSLVLPLALLTLIYSYTSEVNGKERMNQTQGLRIQLSHDAANDKNKLRIEGSFSVFVNCGSQYAIWSQFPETIMFTIKNLESGQEYESIDNHLSISWDGNQVYDEYSQKPCDQIVTEKFSIAVDDVYFKDALEDVLGNIELTAKYLEFTSNSINVKDSKIRLKKF